MANNNISKYSKTGGLNPLWVEQDIQRRNEEKHKSTIEKITNAAVNNICNNINNTSANNINNNNFKNSKKVKLKLDEELEIKFKFLKNHSDGTESEYEMAKYIIASMNNKI